MTLEALTKEELERFQRIAYREAELAVRRGALRIEEEDGSPTLRRPKVLRVTNGDLTDNGDGTLSLAGASAAAAGAPTDADYLVGTADGDLSNEIAVGTTPGGELGGTWASPSVDTSHAEGSHSSMIATHAALGDAHHAEEHTLDSHSDTALTGAEGNELSDGSETVLHSHAAAGGIDIIPPGLSTSSHPTFISPAFIDNTGSPTRLVLCSFKSTTVFGVITFSRKGGVWVFDSAVDVLDASVTIGVTSSHIGRMHAFAIESPADATNPVLFIMTHSTAGTPDTFAMRSAELVDGSTSVSTVAVTIAGANAPPDTDLGGQMSIPITADRIMTFFQDDIYFGDITGDETGFTVTYTDAAVTAFDTDVDISSALSRQYSAACIGTQVVLLRGGAEPSATASTSGAMWELTTAGVLTTAFNPFTVGAAQSYLVTGNYLHAAVFQHEAAFKLASPFGTDLPTRPGAYLVSPFPLDDF